jgi:metal-responsive CopG/Arc/MetJ family transcriptional regulator
MRMQTYTDAIENLLSQSVLLPPQLLAQIEDFVNENKQLGYTTREELIRDAIRWRLRFLREDYEYIEVPKEEYERAQQAIKEMEMPFTSANDFIEQQIRSLLEKYSEATKQREAYDKQTGKRR